MNIFTCNLYFLEKIKIQKNPFFRPLLLLKIQYFFNIFWKSLFLAFRNDVAMQNRQIKPIVSVLIPKWNTW